MAKSIFSRKRDFAYLIYFLVSIPMMFLMDLQAIYPPDIVPGFMRSMGDFYITTYGDRFFMDEYPTPVWFKTFIWSEVLFQAPVGVWAVWGLLNDSPKVPLLLLPFACLIFITTGTCIAEFAFWDVSSQQKIDLSTLYGPYLALSAFMGLDMFFRLYNVIEKSTLVNGGRESKKVR